MTPTLRTPILPCHQASNSGFTGWLVACTRRTCPAFLLILLLTQSLLAQPGWKDVTPFSRSGFYTDIYFTDPYTGYLSGDDGIVYKTMDGGESWRSTNNPGATDPNPIYHGIHFPSANTGYAVGRYCKIIKTTNAGQTWTLQSNVATTRDLDAFGFVLHGVHFTDDNTGFAVGWLGTILKTTNGGNTWTDVPNPYQGTNAFYEGVHFVDAQTGYVAGYRKDENHNRVGGVILKTTNGGITWVEQPKPVNSISTSEYTDVFFINATTGYAVGSFFGPVPNANPPHNVSYGIIKTTDGGQTWHIVQESARLQSAAVHFLNEQTGFVASGSDRVASTTDGGQSWQWEDIDIFGSTLWLLDVHFTQANRGYVAGTRVYRYTGLITCTPATLTFPYSGGSRSTALSYPDDWTIAVNAPWLTVDKTSGRGNATLTVTATQANPTGDARTGTITLSTGPSTHPLILTFTQEGAPATLSVSTTALSFPDTYQEQTFQIVSNATTTITSNLPGISADPNPVFGNRTVVVQASQNLSAKSRSGTLTVTGGGLTRTINFTQAGGPTHLALSRNNFSFPIEGGGASFAVESNNDWLISGKPDWLTLSAAGGTDNADIDVTATPFAGVGSRSCTLTVTAGGKTAQLVINQAGITPTLSVSPTNFSFSADTTSRAVTVISNADWQVRTSAAWLLASPASGRGDGGFTLTALANATTLTRSGTVTAFVPNTELEVSISVTQARSFLNPTSLSFAALAEDKPLEVLNGGTWSLSTSVSWLTVSPGSHTGTATVTVSAATNPGPAVRSGRITLTYAGGSRTQTVFVSQAGTAPPVKISQSITFGPLPAKTTLDAPFALTATASSGLAVSYRSDNPLVATIAGNVLTLVGEGTALITAAQGGDASYLPAAEVSQTLTVGAPLVNTWRGTDTWSNASHWSEGAAPSLASDGLIASGTARVSGTASVATLTLLAGAGVEVPAGSTLIINGDLINWGGTLSGTGRVRFTKAGTASLTGGLAVAATVEVAPGTTLSTGNGLTLQEGAILLHGAGTPGGGGSVVGHITSKRTGKTGSAYNGWSSPVSSAATGTLGGTVYAYDETRAYANYQRWLPASGTMQPAKGYFARGAGSVAFTGTANEGTFTLPLSYTASHPLAERGFNLVGNPYPGPIDYDAFIDANPSINGALYFWDDDNSAGSGYDNTDYVVRTAAGVVAGPNSGALAGQGISAHQGFFVQANGPGSVSFTNPMRQGSVIPSFFRKSAGQIQRVKLSLSGQGAYNETLVAFAGDATPGHDRRYDAPKLAAKAGLSFASQLAGQDYAIQALPLLTADRVVALSVEAAREGNYSLKAAELAGIDAAFWVLLEDKLTGQRYDLRGQDQVSLQLAAGVHRDRFVLHFRQAAAPAPAPTPEPAPVPVAREETLQVFAWGHNIYVRFSGESTKQVSAQIFNLRGQKLEDFPARPVTRQLVLACPGRPRQVYLLRLTTPQGVVTKRVLLGR
jgi:photosystem II stability/assembly factor-like uncharacterized protein